MHSRLLIILVPSKIPEDTLQIAFYLSIKGIPEDGIAPGTAWEDVDENWECPKCGVTKADFVLLTV